LSGSSCFQVGQSLGHPGVVDHRPPQAEPGEIADQNDQPDDRHVVGLGDDVAKIVVGHAQAEIEQKQVDDRPGHQAVGHEPAVGDHRGEADRRTDEERGRSGHVIDGVADKLRQIDLAAEQIGNAHGLEDQCGDAPDQGP